MLDESRFPWTNDRNDHAPVAVEPEPVAARHKDGAAPDRTQPPENRAQPGDDQGDDEKSRAKAKDAKADDKGEAEDKRAKPSFLRRHPVAIALVLIAIVALAVAGYFYWLIALHPYESTDDAFVDSRQFALAPKVSGAIAAVAVTDNQHVKAGDVLFRIDPRDYQAALDEAKARVAAAQASVDGADAQIAAQQAQVAEAQAAVTQAEAGVRFAQAEADRAQTLARTGTGTVQSAQQQTSSLQEQQAGLGKARAGVTTAQKQVDSLKAQKATAIADLREAKAQEAQAALNLSYVDVTAAQDGRVVQLSGAVGQYVQAGQSVSMFVPDDIWVTANFKETQITDMRPGQAVKVEIDAYPDHEIRGHVDSVQPGSGTAFSLLPAENATGNYVKVVQRVPVKIVVDNWPKDVSIGPGMSVVPTVTVRPRT